MASKQSHFIFAYFSTSQSSIGLAKTGRFIEPFWLGGFALFWLDWWHGHSYCFLYSSRNSYNNCLYLSIYTHINFSTSWSIFLHIGEFKKKRRKLIIKDTVVDPNKWQKKNLIIFFEDLEFWIGIQNYTYEI